MAKTYSGQFVIKILTRFFGFTVVSQKGSHVKLHKEVGHRTITTIVPLHRELAQGTFRGVLDLADISESDFNKCTHK